MFCNGLQNAEYCIFNKPVNKQRFDLFLQQYNSFMTTELAFSPHWPNYCLVETLPKITADFS
jgi:hypothetical protein